MDARALIARTGNFALSLVCGIAVPLSPLEAENWVKGDIDAVSWFATGVTYVAAIGLVSRSSAILIMSLLGAAALAFVYGVDMESIFTATHTQPPTQPPLLDTSFARISILAMSAIYTVERALLHLVDNKPFLEF